MADKQFQSMDGNSAVAYSAHAMNEVIAIYPITPSSPMGEISDVYSSQGQKNVMGEVPVVYEMQSEGGASGAIHGALSAGSLATTFTASQGLLLMIPNMFKIAGELLPTVFHIAARSIAIQALSIFGDHLDVMATRSTGFSMVASNNPQEAMDLAAICQGTTLKASVPFLHFFDGFRTSHEIKKVELIPQDVLKQMMDQEDITRHRSRALNPNNPIMKGTAENPDIFFQNKERQNKFYEDTPEIFDKFCERFEKLTGRKYRAFDYVGDKDAETVVIAMASGADVIDESVEYLNNIG